MNTYSLRPGDVIGTDVRVGPYLVRHVGVVSSADPYYGVFVISNSKKAGMIAEEHLDTFTGGGDWKRHPELRGRLSSQEVVRRARKRIGDPWRLFGDNCEHFVREVQGLLRESPQVAAGIAATAFFGLLTVAVVGAATALASDD